MFNKIIFEIFHCDIKFILNTMNTWYVEVIQNQKDTSLITIKHSFGHMTIDHVQSEIQIWPVWPISDLAVFWLELSCLLRDQFVILVKS